jgi:hypothetical protein
VPSGEVDVPRMNPTVYQFTCLCGRDVKTDSIVGACPHCARLYDLRWPNDAPPAMPVALPAKLSA